MPKPSHSLILRTASALILMPLVLFALIHGGVPFIILAGAGLMISLYEWAKMAALDKNPIQNAVIGFSYILFCFAALFYMRLYQSDGVGLTLSLILCIWASDTGAYFAGKMIGGPKMAPSISPNKTWAGLIGGMISSAATYLLYTHWLGPILTKWVGVDLSILEFTSGFVIFILGASFTITGQIGDLMISHEKRRVGVKDTGNLIPGHGGLLDRIDSLLLAAPIFLLILKANGL